MTCREEVLKVAQQLARSSGDGTFTLEQVLAAMRREGTRYQESTIRTHVTSRMCVNAPAHHALVYADFERVGPGTYRLSRRSNN